MYKLTPMMEQYMAIKKEYQDYILFFRLGDFYEMFFDDAVVASKVLDITLTARGCGLEEKAPLAGVPYHAAEGYLAKLVKSGLKVAICEQIEDPKEAKGIVKRAVTRIVTPGTVTDPNMLSASENNYVCCLYEDEKGVGIAYSDISTSELKTTHFLRDDKHLTLMNALEKISPKELLIDENYAFDEKFMNFLKDQGYLISYLSGVSFKLKQATQLIKRVFNVYAIESLGLSESEHMTIACGGLLSYIEETQKVNLKHFDHIDIYHHDEFMVLDRFTRRNLELVETMRGHEKKGSLLWVLDKTATAMGGRLLRQWLEAPLLSKSAIEKRLEATAYLYDHVVLRQDLNEYLSRIYDLERLSSKLVYNTANARDLLALKQSLAFLPQIKKLIERSDSQSLKILGQGLDPLEDIFVLLEASILEEAPLTLRDGQLIKETYHDGVKELRDILAHGKNWLIELEQEERQKTGIPTLKIRFNKVFGYYVEVTRRHADQVPDYYIRKQTLANAERYIYPELKEIETKILNAGDEIKALEYNLFNEIKDEILEQVLRIKKSAQVLATLDCYLSLAMVAYSNDYVKPRITDQDEINILEGRHPVVEKLSVEEGFVPNDTVINQGDSRFYIITGPNMAGKSTYLRQVALITLMAQIGSFVPAKAATISIVDRIFTRVGASDDLAQGQSTFMVEMNELSNILHHASHKSLIILDEIGRGTSTYDGLSIAWSVVEYLSQNNHMSAKTLFATHYHELTELEGRFDGVKNYCISVKESGDDITFLRKIIRGGANRSYGIQVAKLAGIPKAVIQRAKEILEDLEAHDINNNISSMVKNEPRKQALGMEVPSWVKDIKDIDVLRLSPLEAMNVLNDLVEKAKNDENI